MKRSGLYVDDLREPPHDDPNIVWTVARSFHEAIYLLEKWDYYAVSLDHDIASFYGNKEMKGTDILYWLIDRKLNRAGEVKVPEVVRVHSANPVGCDTMEADIKRHWG